MIRIGCGSHWRSDLKLKNERCINVNHWKSENQCDSEERKRLSS